MNSWAEPLPADRLYSQQQQMATVNTGRRYQVNDAQAQAQQAAIVMTQYGPSATVVAVILAIITGPPMSFP